MKTPASEPRSFKERTGYSRINLNSRKEKDRRQLQRAKERVGAGEDQVTFKTKSAGLSSDGSTASGRGARVRVYGGEKEVAGAPRIKVVHKTVAEPSTTTKTKSFQPADYNNNRVNIRSTTSELGKQMKERPTKTLARMKAQQEKKTTYDYKYPSGKTQKELSGIEKEETVTTPGAVRLKAETKIEPTTRKIRSVRSEIKNNPPSVAGAHDKRLWQTGANSDLRYVNNAERKKLTSHSFKNKSTRSFQNKQARRRARSLRK